jgi:hypothetical protein
MFETQRLAVELPPSPNRRRLWRAGRTALATAVSLDDLPARIRNASAPALI